MYVDGIFFSVIIILISLFLWFIGLLSEKIRNILLAFIKKERNRLKLSIVYLFTIPLFSLIIIIISFKMIDQNSQAANKKVVHSSANLIWEDSNSTIFYTNYTWEDAVSYCEDSHHAGYEDWRLPTLDELKTIVKPTTDSNAIAIIDGFNTMEKSDINGEGIDWRYWTNTVGNSNHNDRMIIDFHSYTNKDGYRIYSSNKHDHASVRCVRNN